MTNQIKSKKKPSQIDLFGEKKEQEKAKGPQRLGDVLAKYERPEKNKYVSKEFQDYGYRLAMELGDEKHKALYIRLAKKESRNLLEKARSFVLDAGAKNPGALFMWKLKQLREEKKDTQ